MKKDTVHRILGSGYKENREFADFYPTPEKATRELLKAEQFNGIVWECACGNGAISRVVEKEKIEVVSSDILDYGYGTPNIDFLNDNSLFNNFHFKADHIITNPPFTKATEFIYMAKKWSNQKIAMILRTNFLEGVERYKLFQDKKFPLKTVYQFSKRVSFGDSKTGGMIAFAWFVWDKNYIGDPMIKWIL